MVVVEKNEELSSPERNQSNFTGVIHKTAALQWGVFVRGFASYLVNTTLSMKRSDTKKYLFASYKNTLI